MTLMPVRHSQVERIENTAHLEDLLSEPTEQAVEALAGLEGDLLILGVSGKMGPTLARMARRALDQAGSRRRVIGAARFGAPGAEDGLRAHGVETVRCDLLDGEALARLPDAACVLVMVGMKFGATGQEARTWAVNAFLPGLVCQRFRRARIVAFSTGNVYGLTPVALGGSRESDALAPVGEYAMSCLGRERLYEHFSRTLDIPMAMLRLNYAVEMRYGVLVDLARRVQATRPIDLRMGQLNAIWQADANAAALCAFAHVASPPRVVNIAGPELLSVRRLAEQFAELLGVGVAFEGSESADALLSNGQLGHRLFGYPRVGAAQLVGWTADWLSRGGETLDKPTHFDVRDGKF
jgi:nucleoside-diphosphate-sugar epimerase